MIDTPLQIRFADADSAGHVHNSVYLHYFEIGRVDFFVRVIAGIRWDWKKQGLILARNEIDYLKPLLFTDQNVFVRTRHLESGKKSITLGYEVISKRSEEEILHASGKSIVVCFDYTVNSTIEIPQIWKENLTSSK